MISIFIIRYHIKNLVLQHQAKTEEDYHCRYLHIFVYVIIFAYYAYSCKKSIREFAKTERNLSKAFITL